MLLLVVENGSWANWGPDMVRTNETSASSTGHDRG